MEIHEELDIQICHTLGRIRLAYQMLKRHLDSKSQNSLIDQYKFLKKDLCEELAERLSQALNTKVQIVV